MSIIYYPSCKFTTKFPEANRRIQAYLTQRHGMKIAGCCKASLKATMADDTVVYVCNTCAVFFRENTPAKNIVSLWELLIGDKDFSFPSYAGRRMTVQDCWRVYDGALQQNAVRAILNAMDIEAAELEENREKTRFCGTSLYEPLLPNYDKLAPGRLVRDAQGFFIPHTEEEKTALMETHCAAIETDEVVCTCVACHGGIARGGKTAIHLAELVFGAEPPTL